MSHEHILLADDDPRDVQLILAALKENGVVNKVVVVSDGEQALDYLFRRKLYENREEGHPIVTILDLKMPKVGGLEVLKIVKADEHLKMLPIIMLTSSRETSDLEECYRLGANAYVVKPVDFGEFVKAVGRVGIFWTLVNKVPSD